MRTAEQIIQAEVHYCISYLVSTLAKHDGQSLDLPANDDLAQMTEQAFELAAPIADYEEAAREAGFEVRHDMYGFYACTTEEAEHEDDGNSSVGFDGRPHFTTIEDAARDICEANDIDPYDREVFEHWIVSNWLADKLEAKGEKVDRDFAGMIVWARTTTGQAISMDSVIEAIRADLVREYGE